MNSEDREIQGLLEALGSKNGMDRKKAREKLVAMGSNITKFLLELYSHPKHILRWEALKTAEEIGDSNSIPLFIQALEDDAGDLRWIAAEGLIKLGVESIQPLLHTLIEKSDSVFILAGIHHVFYDLKKRKKLPPDFPIEKLLPALKSSKWEENIKSTAYELLRNIQSYST